MTLGLNTRQILLRSLAALLLGLAISLPAAYLLISSQEGGGTGGVRPVTVKPSPQLEPASDAEVQALALLVEAVAQAASVPVIATKALPIAAGAAEHSAQAPSSSGVIGTNVQVEGVDEGDIADISGDGRLVAVARGGEVIVHDIVGGGAPASIEGPGGEAEALSFVGDRLLVVVWGGLKGAEPGLQPSHVELWLVSLEDPRNPVVVETHRVSGSYVAMRVDDGRILLVTDATPEPSASGVPWLDSRPLSDESLAIVDPLPSRIIQVTLLEPGVSAESIVVAAGLSVRVVAGNSVLALAWSTPYDPERLGAALREALASIAGSITEARSLLGRVGYYEAGAEAVLAFSAGGEWLREKASLQAFTELLREAVKESLAPSTTVVFISYDDGLKLLGKAKVKGVLLDQFAVNPLGDGLYVVATTIVEPSSLIVTGVPGPAVEEPASMPAAITISIDGETRTIAVAGQKRAHDMMGAGLLYSLVPRAAPAGTPLYNAVYIISVEGEVVAGFEGFGEGFRLRAARLVGSVLYVSAYTVRDPIYAIDLSIPEEPMLLGELRMPGWSEYLHYIGNGLLLGVGYTDDRRSRIVLIDVSEPASPRLVDELVINGLTLAASMDEYHAFTYDPDTGMAYLVAYRGSDPVGVVAVKVSGKGFSDPVILEVEGALRVFAAGDRLVVAARDYVALFDRETLEPLVRALGTG